MNNSERGKRGRLVQRQTGRLMDTLGRKVCQMKGGGKATVGTHVKERNVHGGVCMSMHFVYVTFGHRFS